MKNVLLSHDDKISVYSVPDVVAEKLNEYCSEFADKWLWTSPHAEKYKTNIGVCYGAQDFIDYLNEWVLPDTPSILIETLDNVWNVSDAPEIYRKCKWFNF